MSFEEFLTKNRTALLAGFVAAYGAELGQEAAAEAEAYGWQHWDRLRDMTNPVGYLYRVGQSAIRGSIRSSNRNGTGPNGYLPAAASDGLPEFEPGLAPALESLSESQRISVVLVHGLGWTLADTAAVLDVDVSTVRTHIRRGLIKLRSALKVETNVN